jgi:cell fate regulator YaaT (PSP1 superfamily)
MKFLVGIKFKKIGKICYLYSTNTALSLDDMVICSKFDVLECGRIVVIKSNIEKINALGVNEYGEYKILRKASGDDLKKIEDMSSKKECALSRVRDKIVEHNLDMQLVDMYHFFDKSKIIFYFTASKRVDFRNLVRDLVKIFKTRVELMQIGVRDETKILGGIGVCGIPVCCAAFLDDFKAVSVKMAKDQGVTLAPNKISGMCGRLMCCLAYEVN